VLKGEQSVSLRVYKTPAKGKATRRTAAAAANPVDDPLFERLRAWRAEAAREHGVPAYVIFHDATLRAIAEIQPTSLHDLRGVAGIGAKKLEAYGDAILEVVSEG
jgi:ATP-dependent DNA helicase RecQ